MHVFLDMNVLLSVNCICLFSQTRVYNCFLARHFSGALLFCNLHLVQVVSVFYFIFFSLFSYVVSVWCRHELFLGKDGLCHQLLMSYLICRCWHCCSNSHSVFRDLIVKLMSLLHFSNQISVVLKQDLLGFVYFVIYWLMLLSNYRSVYINIKISVDLL